MRVGLIGVGNIGGALAAHFVAVGHEIAVTNSRGPESLATMVRELGEHARAMTVPQAIAFGDVVVESIPFGRYRELPREGWDGKIVIDTANYYPQRDGIFAELEDDSTTSSELVQRHLTGSRVVKAFNAIYAASLRTHGKPPGDPRRQAIPISGDDAEAKRVVAELIDQIGFDAVDAGGLSHGGRVHQRGAALYTKELTKPELQAALAAHG